MAGSWALTVVEALISWERKYGEKKKNEDKSSCYTMWGCRLDDGVVERTSNDVKMRVKYFQMIQTQIDQLTKVQKDLLVNASREKHACEISTRSGATTQDPLYSKRHPKRIEQDSQRGAGDGILPKKKKRSIKEL
jgi:hypothetical protein